MNNWQEYHLTDIYEINSGLSKSREFFGAGYDFVTFKDVFDNFFIPKELTAKVQSSDKERQSCSVRRGDVFLTRTSETMDELGMSSVALRDYPNATFNGFTKRLRPKDPDLIVPEYAGYYFRSPEFRSLVSRYATMTTRASLNNEIISRLTIRVPPRCVQERIGEILKSLDDKIELNNQINENLEALAQTIFKRWFVDFEFPDENGQPYKSSGGEMVESELGEIPKGWRVSKMQDIANITIGRTPPRREQVWFEEQLNENNYKWISIRDMGNAGTFLFETAEFLTKEAVQKFKIPIIPNDTVVVSFKLTVGRVAITTESMLSNEAIAHIKTKDSSYSTEFLFCYLKQFNFDSLGSTSSIATAVNSKSLQAIPVINGPSDLHSQFTTAVRDIFAEIRRLSLESIQLRQLRDLLLPRIISGQMKIKANWPSNALSTV